VQGDNEVVNLKDLKITQEIVMKESVTANTTLTGCDSKGFSNRFFSKKRKRDTMVKCYINNAKKRMQTSKVLNSQVCWGETQ
jgi:hypothetical protein